MDCAIENDGSLVIGEFVDECGVQFWSADARGTVTWPSAEVAAR